MNKDWISVNDSLPEFGEPVFVGDIKEPANSVSICRLESVTVKRSKDGEDVSHEWMEGRTGMGTWYYDVTHWCKLPKL